MAHFLLIYDRDAGCLLRKEEFQNRQDAMSARFSAESEFSGRDGVEIVALSASSEEHLRLTHGRYFLDLAELAGRLG